MCVLLHLQLKQLGHSVDKVEFIVMGGTFMALPEEYRDYFIRNLHDALSGHTSNSVAEAVRYEGSSIVLSGRGTALSESRQTRPLFASGQQIHRVSVEYSTFWMW